MLFLFLLQNKHYCHLLLLPHLPPHTKLLTNRWMDDWGHGTVDGVTNFGTVALCDCVAGNILAVAVWLAWAWHAGWHACCHASICLLLHPPLLLSLPLPSSLHMHMAPPPYPPHHYPACLLPPPFTLPTPPPCPTPALLPAAHYPHHPPFPTPPFFLL